jgi:hypothetical protein
VKSSRIVEFDTGLDRIPTIVTSEAGAEQTEFLEHDCSNPSGTMSAIARIAEAFLADSPPEHLKAMAKWLRRHALDAGNAIARGDATEAARHSYLVGFWFKRLEIWHAEEACRFKRKHELAVKKPRHRSSPYLDALPPNGKKLSRREQVKIIKRKFPRASEETIARKLRKYAAR